MDVGTRVIGVESVTLYPGDIVEGRLAAMQVAAGNATELAEESADSKAAPASPKQPHTNEVA